MLFSFSMLSLADNARLDAIREAEQDVNETLWSLTGFSVPLLIGGWYMAGGTTVGGQMAILTISGVVLFFRMLLRSYPLLAGSCKSFSSDVFFSETDKSGLTLNSAAIRVSNHLPIQHPFWEQSLNSDLYLGLLIAKIPTD